MKYLNLVFAAVFVMCMVSCKSDNKIKTHIESAESMEVEDEIVNDDEFEFLESAVDALKEGNSSLAAENIMKSVEQIKGYVGEMDDPELATNAISKLTELATKIKNGSNMSAEDLEEAILKLELFSEDDLDIDDDEVEDN